MSDAGRILPPFFSVGRRFADEHGPLRTLWASAAGREARLYDTDGLLLVDGQPVSRGEYIDKVYFSPDGRRVLYERWTEGDPELVEDGVVVCTGSFIRVWFSPDGARWALRFCEHRTRDEVCQVDGVEVFRAPWDHYMGGSGWEPPWIEPEP